MDMELLADEERAQVLEILRKHGCTFEFGAYVRPWHDRTMQLDGDFKPEELCCLAEVAAYLSPQKSRVRVRSGWWHKLMHVLGFNRGEVETWYDGERLMVGFRCSGCGILHRIHESITTREA